MKAIRFIPGKSPELIEVENTLTALQEQVGGHIEVLSLGRKVVAILNEEGLLLGLPYNGNFGPHAIFGTILVVGVDGEDFCDVPQNVEVLMERPMRWPEDRQ